MLRSKYVLALVIVSILAVLPADAVCFKRIFNPKTSDIFEYTSSLIDSFGYAKEALAATDTTNDNPDVLAQLVQLIYQLKSAEEKYSCAVETVAPYEKSSVETIAVSAKGAAVVFGSLALLQRQMVSVIQTVADSNSDIRLGELAGKIADLQVKVDQTWKNLPLSAVAATHVLVRLAGNPQARLSTLSVTADQRKVLAEQLVSIFGESVKDGAKGGQHALVVSAALLYNFISDANWKSSDTP